MATKKTNPLETKRLKSVDGTRCVNPTVYVRYIIEIQTFKLSKIQNI